MNGALIRRGIAAVFCVSIAWAALHAEEQGPPAKGKNAEKAPAPAKPASKEADDDGGKGPPPDAKGFKLAQFIKGQLGKGLTGDKLAEAINKERAKLGLKDDDKDDAPSAKPAAPGKDKGKGKDKD